jgi:hypothetical protein
MVEDSVPSDESASGMVTKKMGLYTREKQDREQRGVTVEAGQPGALTI